METREFKIQVHITEKCQYKCEHCYLEDKKRKNMSLEQFKEIIDKFVPFCKELEKITNTIIHPVLHITGGDPLLHPDLRSMLKYCDMKAKVGMLGNPDLITEKSVAFMKNSGVRSYQISIDGDAKYHEAFRKSKGSYKKSLKALKVLEDGGIKAVVMYNVKNENLKHIINTYKKIGKLCTRFAFARVVGSKDVFETERYLKIIKRLLKIEKRYKAAVAKKEPLTSLVTNPCGDLFGGCEAGTFLLTVDSECNIYPCSRLPIIIGNTQKDDFLEMFLNNSVLNSIRFDSECKGCKFYNTCRGCPAVAYSKTGSCTERDPDCLIVQRESGDLASCDVPAILRTGYFNKWRQS